MRDDTAPEPPRLLVVDDNPAIHEDIRKILGPAGLPDAPLEDLEEAVFGSTMVPAAKREPVVLFRVDGATQGQQGVAMVRRACAEGRPYSVAFVDARMPPGWDGIETISRLWAEDAEVQVVLCTAYSDYTWQQIRTSLAHPERLVILKKPFDTIEVLQLADSLSEKWRLGRSERCRVLALERMLEERQRGSAEDVSRAVCASGVRHPASVERDGILSQALPGALEREELTVVYQPLVEIATRRVVSLEALLRWQHPQLGSVSPAEFIPVAENTGLIVPIGEYVLREVCAQSVRWQSANVPIVPIAVNTSAVQLETGEFWQRMRAILREQGCAPRQVALELTESALVQNAEHCVQELQALRRDGTRIEIDDFGTGYSSLSTLKHLPVDTIKIDRSFITQLGSNHTDEAILAAILAMTRSLGLRAVAEGVESLPQLEILARHGCEIAQGYYFCAPISAAECGQLLVDVFRRTSLTDTMRTRRPAGVPTRTPRAMCS
jgi:EAL domain-containing protein (putative c-di-GMP-specific phosphodiesterase class I)/DNA-binding NarL/FixJ family response regulator